MVAVRHRQLLLWRRQRWWWRWVRQFYLLYSQQQWQKQQCSLWHYEFKCCCYRHEPWFASHGCKRISECELFPGIRIEVPSSVSFWARYRGEGGGGKAPVDFVACITGCIQDWRIRPHSRLLVTVARGDRRRRYQRGHKAGHSLCRSWCNPCRRLLSFGAENPIDR